jgi:D-galactose 1-dehydrogenase
MSTHSPIRIAIVGVGKIARDQHIPAILDSPDFELVALISQSARDAEIPVFASLDAAFAAGLTFDAVAICTPPGVRSHACRMASAHRCAILLEKPPAATVAEARALKQLAEGAGVPIFASWHARFAPMISDAAAWCRAHALRSGRIDWFEDAGKWHPGQAWLWQPGGFGVFDPGINALSILTALYPRVWQVSEPVLEIPANVEMPLSAQLSLKGASAEVRVAFDFRPTAAETWSIHLEADDGSTLDLTEGGVVLSVDGGAAQRGKNGEYAGLYRRFAELVRSGESDFDVSPLKLTEDAFASARIVGVEPITI